MKWNKKILGIMLGWSLLAASIGGFVLPARQVKAEDDASTVDSEVHTLEERAVSQIRLTVGDGQTTPQYEAGQEVQLEVKVTNQGSADAQNVRVQPVIENLADWPFETGKWNYEQNLGTIPAGDTGTAVYGADEKLKVRGDVETKTYTLKFQIIYDDGTVEYDPIVKSVYVSTTAAPKPEEEAPKDDVNAGMDMMGDGGVYNSDPIPVGGSSTNGSVPRVIIAGFSTEPGEVNAGSDFKLIIHVKNTSSKTAVSNMVFDIQAPASGTEAAAEAPAFLPASGGSSIYLEKIPAGGTKDISIQLNARADLVQKPYSVEVAMKYEDSDATQYEASSSVAIPIKQAARFEFSELQISPENIQVGEEANITCSIYNTGRTKLYNVKAKFEGTGISAQEVFVGNLESGATGSIDGMLVGESEMMADTKCKMIVSYEDEAGKVSTVEQEFQIEVLAAADEMDNMMMEEIPEQSGMPILPIVIVVIILVAVTVAVIVIRKSRRKKARKEEEDLLDEVDRFIEDE